MNTAARKYESCDCPFCHIPAERVILENAQAYAIQDGFPVTQGHSLVIPRRHVVDYFGLADDEILACNSLIRQLRYILLLDDPKIAGFNVGMNAGAAAGQTIFHCHIHVIPRRDGDLPCPRGGVRHIIPGKGHY